ncbi:BrnT family toxin [Sphingobium sp. PNB]|uniref:BrnT family toxin n=1 Tax=Sphingobium sp. PNB TaxID=863934 RepID=UPI001CA45FD2|nr:BrnT family toxin [Sphingobium sp. PNB]MCB4863114.1 BrnT family toxin [Sphingobium sp. PNB]
MEIEFDSAKDAANIEKHGISLSRAADLEQAVVVEDDRFAERRFRIYGQIDGLNYCAAVTLRGRVVRVISLRRAHAKETKRHA